MATKLMRCQVCGGHLDVNEGQEILFCPYCGSKELVLESDEVKIERIKAKAYTDVELEKLKNEANEQKEDRKAILYYILGMIGLALAYVLIMKFINM